MKKATPAKSIAMPPVPAKGKDKKGDAAKPFPPFAAKSKKAK